MHDALTRNGAVTAGIIDVGQPGGFLSLTPRSDIRRVLTYGTFDLLHYGHIRFLHRAAALGDYLVVALSTDEFNAVKGKKSFYSYEFRREMLEAIRCVDLVVPERSWEQKRSDIEQYRIDVVCMGDDWRGSLRFEPLRDVCELVYLPRTEGISTTEVKDRLSSACAVEEGSR